MKFLLPGARRCFGVALVFVGVVACSEQPDAGSEPTPESPGLVPATSDEATDSEVSEQQSTPPPVSHPDDWFDTELTTSLSEAHPGDAVDVSIVCPGRGRSFEAPFVVVHSGLRFAQQEVPAGEADVYSTSFVVPYWLEPGELQLRGQCPRPPGPCDDTSDCPEYDSDPVPVVTLPLVSREDPWDSWRPTVEPYLDPVGDVGSTLPGGAIVTGSDPDQVRLDAQVGDRIQVTAQCPVDAVDGARFVIVPLRTLSLANDARDDVDWLITGDPDQPGRYVVSSDMLGGFAEFLDEPLPCSLRRYPSR